MNLNPPLAWTLACALFQGYLNRKFHQTSSHTTLQMYLGMNNIRFIDNQIGSSSHGSGANLLNKNLWNLLAIVVLKIFTRHMCPQAAKKTPQPSKDYLNRVRFQQKYPVFLGSKQLGCDNDELPLGSKGFWNRLYLLCCFVATLFRNKNMCWMSNWESLRTPKDWRFSQTKCLESTSTWWLMVVSN